MMTQEFVSQKASKQSFLFDKLLNDSPYDIQLLKKYTRNIFFITNNLIEKKEKNNCKFQQEITTSLIKLK